VLFTGERERVRGDGEGNEGIDATVAIVDTNFSALQMS
jgi:hypothetical protein